MLVVPQITEQLSVGRYALAAAKKWNNLIDRLVWLHLLKDVHTLVLFIGHTPSAEMGSSTTHYSTELLLSLPLSCNKGAFSQHEFIVIDGDVKFSGEAIDFFEQNMHVSALD